MSIHPSEEIEAGTDGRRSGRLLKLAGLFVVALLLVSRLSLPDSVGSASCSVYDADEASCSAAGGCTWDMSDCSDFDYPQLESCQMYAGCTLSGTCVGYDETSCAITEGCYANTLDCSQLPDETACFGYSCSWNGTSCDGGIRFTSCNGIPSSATCEGTYEPGTCSGTFDDTAPSVSLTAPADASYASGTVTVSADASDETSLAGVRFKRDGNTTIGAEDTSDPYSVSWDTTELADGDQTLVAVARDDGGNYATSTARTVTVDNTAPTLTLTTGSSSPVTGDFPVFLTSSEAITGFTLGDLSLSNAAAGTLTSTTTGAYRFVVTPTGDGEVTVEVSSSAAIDVAGNPNAASNELSLTADITAPTILSASSTKIAGAYAVGEVVDIDIQFSEAVTSTGNVTVTLETGDADRTCSFSVSGSTYGTCDYTVQEGDTSADLTVSSVSGVIRDAAGNAMTSFAPASNLAANEAIVVDTTAPSVSLTTPTDGATVSGAAVALEATASDANLVGVQFKIDGAVEGAEDTASAFGVTWDATAAAAGAHTVAAVARDLAGNYATSSVSVTVEEEDGVDDEGAAPVEEEEEARRQPTRSRTQGAASEGSGTSSSGAGSGGSSSGVGDSGSAESLDRDLEVGASGEDVRVLQRLLNSIGFPVASAGPGSVGSETDTFGELTRAALIRFQLANGIVPAEGYLGPITRAALAALAAPAATPAASILPRDLQLNDAGSDVRLLQEVLIARLAGSAARALAAHGVTGIFGPLTHAALVELQLTLGVSPATGYFGPLTRAALGL